MASRTIEPPLIVIVGPTASGKTSLSIKLAKKFNGEIISADSRAIYKGMDIGTAKPSINEQDGVPHWGIDIVAPDDTFTVADFKHYANEKISEIRARGKVPFIVGGTGLYIDAVIFDYEFKPKADVEIRKELQHKDITELLEICQSGDIELPENSKNKRYLIRAIEGGGVNRRRLQELIPNTIIVGITTEREVLRKRIVHRAEHIFDDGVVDEAKKLGEKYGWDNEAMTSNIYPLVRFYLDGHMNMNEVKEKFITLDYRLAKRQMTWLRRNKFIKWFDLSDAGDYLSNLLASLG